MKTIYYTVEKQLLQYDNVEETNGWKYINIYEIQDNKMTTIKNYLDVENSVNTEEYICKQLVTLGIISKYDTVKLINL